MKKSILIFCFLAFLFSSCLSPTETYRVEVSYKDYLGKNQTASCFILGRYEPLITLTPNGCIHVSTIGYEVTIACSVQKINSTGSVIINQQ